MSACCIPVFAYLISNFCIFSGSLDTKRRRFIEYIIETVYGNVQCWFYLYFLQMRVINWILGHGSNRKAQLYTMKLPDFVSQDVQ